MEPYSILVPTGDEDEGFCEAGGNSQEPQGRRGRSNQWILEDFPLIGFSGKNPATPTVHNSPSRPRGQQLVTLRTSFGATGAPIFVERDP
jgi:hypothetical protein